MDKTGSELIEEKNEQIGSVQGQGEEKNEYDGFRVREKRRMNMAGSGLREEKDVQNGFRVE